MFTQVSAKGLCRRQEHTSVAHGVTFHEVEVAVWVGFVVIVQSVAAQQAQQGAVLDLLLWDIGEIHTSCVALQLDIETELGLLYRRGEVIHVLHHQVPVALLGVV